MKLLYIIRWEIDVYKRQIFCSILIHLKSQETDNAFITTEINFQLVNYSRTVSYTHLDVYKRQVYSH